MKKLLISIIGTILLIIIFISAFKGISLGKASIYSVNQIKDASLNLDNKIDEANTEINQNYAAALTTLNTESKELKKAKEEYDAKMQALGGSTGIGLTQLEHYKIEYLWSKIGNYAETQGLWLDLTFTETSISGTYNISFTLEGSYRGIINFLYDIEDDDELNYKVKNFKMEPTSTTTTSTSGNETTTYDTTKLKATFVVENVIVNFN